MWRKRLEDAVPDGEGVAGGEGRAHSLTDRARLAQPRGCIPRPQAAAGGMGDL